MIVLPLMLTVPSCSSKASVVILSRNILKRMAESRHLCRTPAVVHNQSPSDLIIEVFDDSDKVGSAVLHGCPQSCMPNPVKGLLEGYGDMVEVLLVLEVLLTEDS